MSQQKNIRQRELPINRAIHWLRQGVSEQGITAPRIGVTDDELAEIVATAKTRMVENDKAYAKLTRRGSLGYIAFGAAMLMLAFYLAQTDVPVLRQGKLLLGFLIGGGCLAWGLFRFFNHSPKYEF
jgi:hypothetical protein